MLSALLLLGISSVATAPLEEAYVDDDEDEDGGASPNADFRDDVLRRETDRNGLFDLLDGGADRTEAETGNAGEDASGLTDLFDLFADLSMALGFDGVSGLFDGLDDDFGSDDGETGGAGREGAHGMSGTTTIADDDPWPSEMEDAPEDEARLVSDDDPGAPPENEAPEADLSVLDGEMEEVDTFLVGEGDGAEPFADISGFVRGENLLDVTVFADPDLETVDMEVRTSYDGSSSILTVNGEILAVLRGVPDADLDDFRIDFQSAMS